MLSNAFSGKEIENHFYGLFTMFIRELPVREDWISEFPHIYFQTQVIEKHGYQYVENLAKTFSDKIITIELTPAMLDNIPDIILVMTNIHIVINIRLDFMANKLREWDTLKVEYADHYTLSSPVQFFVSTIPADYANDKDLRDL